MMLTFHSLSKSLDSSKKKEVQNHSAERVRLVCIDCTRDAHPGVVEEAVDHGQGHLQQHQRVRGRQREDQQVGGRAEEGRPGSDAFYVNVYRESYYDWPNGCTSDCYICLGANHNKTLCTT